MRTTTTLDDDLFAILEREAKNNRVSFKKILNDTLRRGLLSPQNSPCPLVVTRPFPKMSFRAGIDPHRLNQLCDELEVESFLKKNPHDFA